MFRCLLCWILVAATPLSLTAADAGSAILYAKGEVLRNGQPIPNASPIFSGDLLETKADSVANLNALGSSVIISPNSLVEFDGQSLRLEHGAVSVATSHGIIVRVHCLTVAPASSDWTQFEVSDVDGTIDVAARKNDVRLDFRPQLASAKESTKLQAGTLHEGQQTTRDESDGCDMGKQKQAGAVPAGTGGWLTSQYARYGAVAILGGVGIWLILQPGQPASPWRP